MFLPKKLHLGLWVSHAYSECLCAFFSCSKGLPFCLLSWSYSCAVYPSDTCNCPSQCCGTALPFSHRAGNLSPPQWWHSRAFTAPLVPIAVLLYLAERGLLLLIHPSRRRRDISALMATVAQERSPGQWYRTWCCEGHPCNLALCTPRLPSSMELHEWLRNWGLNPCCTIDRLKKQPLDQTVLNEMMIWFCVFIYKNWN